jgi:hypothetical protein
MSPEDLRELCEKTWVNKPQAEHDAIETSKDGLERTFGLCYVPLTGLIGGTETIVGEDYSVELKSCTGGSVQVGASHTHQDGDLSFSDGDYATALKEGLYVMMLSTVLRDKILVRCSTFNYDLLDAMPKSAKKRLHDHLLAALETRNAAAEEMSGGSVEKALRIVEKNEAETRAFLSVANEHNLIKACDVQGKKASVTTIQE